jgi:hypothetical protein
VKRLLMNVEAHIFKIRDYTSDGKLAFTGRFDQFTDTWQHVGEFLSWPL